MTIDSIDRRVAVQPEGLEASFASANRDLIERAQVKLSRMLGVLGPADFNSHFQSPYYFPGRKSQAPKFSANEIFSHLASRPQRLILGKQGTDLDISIVGVGDKFDMNTLGSKLEYNSSLYFISPGAMRQLADLNKSVEVRMIDQQLGVFADLADLLTAAVGADIYMKLFISGGEGSVNGWHRDNCDVIVTCLDGEKQFEIATEESTEEDIRHDVNILLKAGDILFVPRARLHRATSVGSVSVLLSTGLMRRTDWIFRKAVPSHMPLSAMTTDKKYHASLRSHRSPNVFAGENAVLEARFPRGIHFPKLSSEGLRFSAQGRSWTFPEEFAQVLLEVLKTGWISRSSDLLVDARNSVELAVNSGLLRYSEPTYAN